MADYERFYLINDRNMNNKFWEVRVNGNNYTVRYGGLDPGKRVAVKTKVFDSNEGAKAEMHKMINSKIKGGYRVVEN